MATYNTVPTEDTHLNEPKAPQNRKALIALVAAVCFASACAGAVAPSAVRGLSSLAAADAPASADHACSAGTTWSSVCECCKVDNPTGKITLTDPVATKTDENLCAFDKYLEVWECPREHLSCKEGEYCQYPDYSNEGCFLGSGMDSMGAEADKAGCSREELAAAGKKILELFEDHGAHNNICYQKKKELGTCTRIEIKGTCGTTEVITASMSC